jgi:toxin ParE1/3/4
MARVIWTDPALQDLDTIADYIALDKPVASTKLVRAVFTKVSKLALFPKMGSVPPEIPDLPYRQLVIPPCRVFYPIDKKSIYIVAILRGEQMLRVDRFYRPE